MARHNGMYLTTKDNDSDNRNGANCALLYGLKDPSGGWWYNHSWFIAPNNIYNHGDGVGLNSQLHTLPYIEIKLRPHKCNI